MYIGAKRHRIGLQTVRPPHDSNDHVGMVVLSSVGDIPVKTVSPITCSTLCQIH